MQKRDLYDDLLGPTLEARTIGNVSERALIAKRAPVVGPLLTLPKSCFFCPKPETNTKDCAAIIGWEPAQVGDPDRVSKRDLSGHVHYNHFDKRGDKRIDFCTPKVSITSPKFDSSGVILGVSPMLPQSSERKPLIVGI